MLKLLRNEFEKVEQALLNRGASLDLIADFPALDTKRRDLIQETEQLEKSPKHRFARSSEAQENLAEMQKR